MAAESRVFTQRLLDPTRRFTPIDVRRQDGAGMPGLYAWFVDEAGATDLAAGLGLAVAPGLLYAGQAGAGNSTATLASRVLGNHIGGNTYGSTLRLTLASVLAATLNLKSTGGRRMDLRGEPRLTDWITRHLELSIEASPDRARLDAVETGVLAVLDPPFNLSKRPLTPVRRRLTELRSAFAGSPPGGSVPVRPATKVPNVPGGLRIGLTPEQLARELGLPNAKAIRAYLRRERPRPAWARGRRWGPLPPEIEAAVRSRFGGCGT